MFLLAHATRASSGEIPCGNAKPSRLRPTRRPSAMPTKTRRRPRHRTDRHAIDKLPSPARHEFGGVLSYAATGTEGKRRMLATAQRRKKPLESRLLAMADRLFEEFDGLPVKAVFDAISDARRALRVQNVPASPETIEELARRRLVNLLAA